MKMWMSKIMAIMVWTRERPGTGRDTHGKTWWLYRSHSTGWQELEGASLKDEYLSLTHLSDETLSKNYGGF